MISHEQLLKTLFYDPETGLLTWASRRPRIRVGKVAGSRHPNGYIYLHIDGKHYAAHRLIWFYMTGRWPSDQIDHRDRDGMNNRWANLREATNGQNQANRRTFSKHGMKGVSFHPWLKQRPWEARIRVNRRCVSLGCFPTKEEAHQAYCKAAEKVHGEFAPPSRASAQGDPSAS